MRELHGHKVNGVNDGIKLTVVDEPGPGNACHHYEAEFGKGAECFTYPIKFQNGPIKEVGTNGLTHEVLLAIVEDRLLGFQSGAFACRENAVALTKIQEAMMWLKKRTNDRLARGVEGTHTV